MTETADQNGHASSFPPILYTLADYAATLNIDDQVRLIEPQIPKPLLPDFLGITQRRREEIRADVEARRRRGAEAEADRLRERREGAEIDAARQRALMPRTWVPADIKAAWDAADDETRTEVGYLSGDLPLALFYRGKLNGVHAESEAGKSWLSCLISVQEIAAHHHVAYIDFEDDAISIIRRLKLLGARREDVAAYFHYLSPTGPLTEADAESVAALIAVGGSLAVFDGMTEAMALEGLDGRLENDVAAWHAKVTKPFAAANWAVVVLDHVPHAEKRAIGSQHKRSALTGVSYLLELITPIGKNMKGKSRLRVEKDRGAWVRAHAVPGPRPQWFADMVIDFEGKAAPTANVWPAWPADDAEVKGYDDPDPKLCRAVLAYVAEHPESSTKTDIRDAVRGNNSKIGRCVDWLVLHQFLTAERSRNSVMHMMGPESFDQENEERSSPALTFASTLFDQQV
ncbi:hypothetical protein [Streptomyces sp. NPDC059009]|uniref:hypothetical protein n=1 Tax=Streptomyces sp. NPDC059009 TaxID=3346694 RepID=UPI0036B9DB70